MGVKQRLIEFSEMEYILQVREEQLNRLQNIINELQKKYIILKDAKLGDYDDIAQILFPKILNDVNELDYKEIRNIIFLFQYKYNGTVLCEDYKNIKKVLNRISNISGNRKKQKLYLRVLSVVNRNFDRYPDESVKYANEIIRILKNFKSQGIGTSRVLSFIDEYNKYLFYEKGFRGLADDIISHILKDESYFNNKMKGLAIPLSDSNYSIIYHVLKEYLRSLNQVNSNFISYFLIFKGNIDDAKDLNYSKLRPDIVNCLLKYFNDHFLENNNKGIIKFIDDNYGDPRIERYKSNWIDVSDEIKSIYIRHKVKVSMSFFFEFISHGADMSSTGQRHWKARREYWTWYLDNDLIDDAWVILGPTAERQAIRELNEKEFQSYGVGSLRGDDKKSHIMIKIGELIIIECSHNGSAWFYDSNNSSLPSLGDERYDRMQFAGIKNSDKHTHFHGRWQRQFDEKIMTKTSINIHKIRRGY